MRFWLAETAPAQSFRCICLHCFYSKCAHFFMFASSFAQVLSVLQVAPGLYVVSDTHCPALHGCESNERKQGSGTDRDEVL